MKKQINKFDPIIVSVLIIIVTAFAVWWKFFRVTYDAQGIPNPMVSYEYVNSRPEAKLYYPNGTVYSHFGRKQVRTDEGLGVAFAGAIMTTNDPPEKIYQWYNDWLLAHGWHEDKLQERVKSIDWISVRSYDRGKREGFDVAVDNPKLLGWTIGRHLPGNMTIFEFSYSIN